MAYLIYLDESGNPEIDVEYRLKDHDFFILGGIILKEANLDRIAQNFLQYKNEILPSQIKSLPIHAVELNRIDRKGANIYRGKITEIQGKEILIRLYQFINSLPIEVIAVIIDNINLRQTYYEPEEPYKLAYKFIIERFQKIIYGRNEIANQLGLVNVSFSNSINFLPRYHEQLIKYGSEYVKFNNIHNSLNILNNKESILLQVADMVCYAFQRAYNDNLCVKMDIKNIPKYEQYLEQIKDICTLNIGSSSLNGVPVVVFPKS